MYWSRQKIKLFTKQMHPIPHMIQNRLYPNIIYPNNLLIDCRTRKRNIMSHSVKLIESPVGKLTLIARGKKLTAVLWEAEWENYVKPDGIIVEPDHPVLCETEHQLSEYFAGKRRVFNLELDFVGTDFQKRVWQALLTIPFGETRSYSDIARQIGNEKAVRAVGAANGRNLISIITPCHRVIGMDGSLTGFAGGLEAKRMLLALEGIYPPENCSRQQSLF